MRKRTLGNSGLEVSEIGLGCMGMSASYGTPEERDERESIATLHRAIELGCTFLHTAEVSGPFTNEELLGRALQGRRDQVTLATKFGFRIENGKQVGTERDSRPEHIRQMGEEGLPGPPTAPAGRSTSAKWSRSPCGASGPTASTCSTSTAWTRRCRWRTWRARWAS